MNIKQKTINAFKWHSFFRILSQLFSWGVTIILVRLLDPKDYGLMGMAMIIVGFLDMFNDAGLGAAIIQKENEIDDDGLSCAFWMGCFIGLILTCLVFFLSPLVASFFNEQSLSPILKTLSFGFLLGGLRLVPFNLLTKTLDFKKRGFAELISRISSSFVCIILAFKGYGVWSLAYGHISKEILMNIVIFIISSFKPSFYFSFFKIKKMLLFGANITISRVLWHLYSNADYLIIGKAIGKIQLGYYSIAFQLASIPISKINELIREIVFPAFSMVQRDRKVVRYYYLKNIRMISTVLFPILIGLSLMADDIFHIIIGQKWAASIFIFQVLCLSGLFKTLASQNPPVLNAIGKPQINVKYLLLMTIIMPLSFLGAVNFGINWVAITWIAIYPFLALFLIFKTLDELNLTKKSFFSCLIPPIICCLIMCSFVMLFKASIENRVIQLISATILGSVIYPVSFFILFRIQFNEFIEVFINNKGISDKK